MKDNEKKVEVVESRKKGNLKAGIAGAIGLGIGALGVLLTSKLRKKSGEDPEEEYDDDDYEVGDEVDDPDDEEAEEE